MKKLTLMTRVSAAALLALFVTGTAMAQGVSNTVPGDQDSNADTADQSAGGVDRSSRAEGDEAIVVTAQRRAEQLIDVPLSIAVLSNQRLEASGVRSTLDLAAVTPGLTIQPLGGFSQPVLRGVTTTITGVSNPSNIALYVDGVYVTAQDSFDFDFVDVDQIQVLKGPQGTLYGRNATGGAILVTTRLPSFHWTGQGSVSYASFDTARAQAYLSGPLSSTLAFSLAGQLKRSDGYITNITTANDRAGRNHRDTIRGALLFQPSDQVRFVLRADHISLSDPTGFLSSVLDRNTQALRTHPDAVISSEPWEVNLTFDPHYESHSTGVSLNGDVDFGQVHMNLISGYRTIHGNTLTDVDYGPYPDSSYSRTWSEQSFDQEINFSSSTPGSRLTWVAGVQYARENSRNNPIVFNTGATTRNHTITNYYSAYVDMTYNITDQVALIGGLRYSNEHKDFAGNTGVVPANFVSSSTGSDAWTPRVSLRYSPSNDLSLYASYNRGYKSGGYNTATSNSIFNGQVTPFRPETIDSWEVGLKSHFARGMSLDLAGFYSNYRDVQVGISISTNGVPQSITTNAAAERIWGAEGQLRIALLNGLNAQIGAAYTHGRYSDFPNALVTVPIPGGGNSQVTQDVTGNKIVRSPEFTGSVGLDYSHPTSFGSVFASANYYHSSGYFYAFNDRLHQRPYDTLNARIGVGFDRDRLRLSLFATNLTNEVYAALLFDSPVGDRISYAPPRSYGVQFDFRF